MTAVKRAYDTVLKAYGPAVIIQVVYFYSSTSVLFPPLNVEVNVIIEKKNLNFQIPV